MISISLPLPPTGLRAPGSPTSTAPPGDFALALADMLVIPDAGAQPPAAAVDRQIDAGPGKALPVNDGIDAIGPDSDVIEKGGTAQSASDVDLPQPVAPLVLPAQEQLPPTAPADAPVDRERSAGEERAHARKETIAALPLPIPAVVVPMVVPDAPPASPTTHVAPSGSSGSQTSAIAPVSSAVIASSEIATASSSERPATVEAEQNAVTDERAVASAIGRLAPEPPCAASAAAPIGPDRTAIWVDPVIAQSSWRLPPAPKNPRAPTAPGTAADTTVLVPPKTTPADAPMRPTRFLAKQVAETAVPAEQRPSAREASMIAKEGSGQVDAPGGNVALPSLRSPKPGSTAAVSAPSHEAGVTSASAAARNAIATGAEGARPRNISSVTDRDATLPLLAERRVVGRNPFERAKGPDAPRPEQAPAIANTRPAIDAADGGTLRPRPSAGEQVDVALIDGARPEIKTADRAGRPAPAPVAPQAGASNPHCAAVPDALMRAAPAPPIESAAPAVTLRDPPLGMTPAARTHAAPERVADNGIAPAQATPVAPTPRPIPIVAPAAVPIAAMFGGPRPVDPRAPHGGDVGDAPAAVAHTLATTHAVSPMPAVAEAQRTPLDMRHDDWTQKLIDRIETIRDAANAADTRIKLMPDALGKIDVSMRKDGDTVHVAFTADVPATRAMLADAQPRLAELAQQRGLRLSQASVDAGTGGDSQQRQAPEPSTPTRPIRAAARDEASTETGRVA
jgi:Meckel syndrome type 1 protein